MVCRGPQIWNRLDTSLKKVRSFSKFKKKIKDLLMSHLWISVNDILHKFGSDTVGMGRRFDLSLLYMLSNM